MINFKSPYDSTEIREGLMNIKHSQMELLNQLKNQNHILRKYTPSNPIYQDKTDSNIYSSPPYSINDPFDSHLASNQKSYQPSSYISVHQRDNYDEGNGKHSSATKAVSSAVQKELQTMTEEFHRMKKNYFTEKQKNKDMVLHMEFAASLHNLILKDVLQGSTLDNIKSKIKTQLHSYQTEFTEFKAFGIQQAFNIINLQTDSSFLESRTPRRTQIFPKQHQNAQILKQLNDLKCELRQISLEKQRKSQQVILIKSENEYTISLLNKEIQMKNGKINELVSEIIRQKQSSKIISNQNNDLRSNLQRLKSELQRNIHKIQLLQNFQRKTTQTIDKQHKYIKYAKELQDKLAFLEKESKQKTRLIEIHQQNLNKTSEMAKTFKLQNDKLKAQLQETKQSQQKKSTTVLHLQQKIQTIQRAHGQQISLLSKRNQTEQLSLKQHITQLKKSLDQLLKQQESYKQSEASLQEIKQRKIDTFKLSKTIDHLWKIKEVEYQNIHQVLTQLNLIKTQELSNHSQRLIAVTQSYPNMVRMDSSHSARGFSSRQKKIGSSRENMMSSSREKSKDRGRNY